MQLIEVSEIGVRASIVALTSRDCALQWLIFPMVHLAPPAYYAEVQRRMHRCDVVIADGIDSKIVDAITTAYGAAPESARGRNSDAPEFHEAWRHMPLSIRFGLPLVAPLYGLWLGLMERPDEIQQHLETSDLPSPTVIEKEGGWPELFDLLLHRSDAHVLQQVEEVHHRFCHEKRTIGVAYGALHISAVVHLLTVRLGYLPSSADWITVFDYTS